jgi:hypothetical protein
MGVTVLAATVLAGCNGGRQAQVQQPAGTVQTRPPLAPALTPKYKPNIPDVPVPAGFSLCESRSRNYDTGVARFVDHLYKGSDDKWDVARFYREQMPVSRWTYVTDVFAQGTYTLEFEKGSERCVVNVRKGSWFWPWHRTYIEVRVTTVGRITPPRTTTRKE